MSAKIIPFPTRQEVTLDDEERDLVLLASDEMIAKGGKDLLVQMLKGVRSDLVLGAEVDALPHFAAFSELSLAEIEAKIDQVLEEELLRLEHYGNRTLLVHTPRGWDRVKPLRAALFLASLQLRSANGDHQGIYEEIGRAHREVKHLVLERIERENATRLAPLLESWREREGKGMKRRIKEVLERLSCASPSSSPR